MFNGLNLLDKCAFYYFMPLGPFRKVAWLRLTERLRKGENMNVNTQIRYGNYSEYSSQTTKTGKGGTSFKESMKPDSNIQYKSLGIGFLNVGDTGYGMRATQIVNPDSEDTIIRVSIALGGNEFKNYDVNLSGIDPSNASAVEMFAYCQYADSIIEGSYKWGSWNALKHLMGDAAYSYNSLDEALTEKKNWNASLVGSGIELESESTGKRYTAADLIEMLRQKYELTADDLEDKDWRDMSDKEWEKLLNSFDQNIEAIRDKIKKLKEIQDEAASKAAADAPAGDKANAASSAAQSAAANGFASDVKTEDEEWIEENSWTYDMKTEDQTILHKAAIANEKAQDSLSKSQEIMLTGDTTEGISKTGSTAESASCDDESGEKVWTVTAYTEQGIICKEFKDGVGTLLWQIDFKNPTDYNKVMDYLDNEKEEDILKYARDKEFWEKLIWG